MVTLEEIKFFDDSKINEALYGFSKHPFMKALFHFTFPNEKEDKLYDILSRCYSIQDFHENFICKGIKQVINKSSDGLITKGFDKLEPNESYLFVSNHRDIVLDACILNVVLNDNSLNMTASAIGNNLVHKPALLTLAKLNRNFIIMRDLPVKETLLLSKMTSNYINTLISKEKRSIWIAQRQGRTKDGNDRTEQGILKMLLLNKAKDEKIEYLEKLRIVPVSISYEFDPTDTLKMSELMAKINETKYVKTKNEDFNTILNGIMGKKGRISIVAEPPITKDIQEIAKKDIPLNSQIQELIKVIDQKIHKNYQLCPPNYIAYDMLYEPRFQSNYTDKEKRIFERRIKKRTSENKKEIESFISMYAYPVVNKLNTEGINSSLIKKSF